MFGFEANKILASIIFTIFVLIVIDYIGDLLINPEIPEEQAYKIDVEEKSLSLEEKSNEIEKSFDIEPISPILASASLENGAKLSKKCVSCHNFKKGEPNKIGPNLYGIIGAKKAMSTDYAYSSELSNLGGIWEYEDLAMFLYKPKDYIKGTKMNFAGLKKAQDRADLIFWLRQNSESPFPLP